MEAKGLRIGNLVRCYDCNIEVASNDGKYVTDVVELGRFDIEDVEPIPLTEEWLLKLGFKKDSIDSNYYLDGSRIYPIYKRGIHFNINGLSNCCKDFHYVHQLQNLYFALTGEELCTQQAEN